MRREDLFLAIGKVEDERLARCEKRRKPSTMTFEEDTVMGNHIRKLWLIAAIITLMVLLMGSAVTALVKMHVEDVKLIGQVGKPQQAETQTQQQNEATESTYTEYTYEGEKITFEDVKDVFVELGTYYPQNIPDGYTMTFVSGDAPLNNQLIRYENSNGGLIEFHIYIGGPASSIEIYGIERQSEISVNGLSGLLYEQKGGSRTLVWINKTQGYGFALQGNDPAVDLLAMAESTAEGEPLVPTRTPQTKKALEQLGNCSPEYLPEGYEELTVQGSPLSEGGSWYSYVRKWYVNRTENTNIYLEYETYNILTEKGYTDDARTACSFLIPGYHILRDEIVGVEVEVNGMFGIADKQDIAWADPERHIVYHLHSEDVTGDELLKIAQSISQQD